MKAMKTSKRSALLESIEKWRQVENGELPDLGAENCALCEEYTRDDHPDGSVCGPCPVKEFTGVDSCRNTPYEQWAVEQRHLDRGSYGNETWVANTPELVALARKEREFLESLL